MTVPSGADFASAVTLSQIFTQMAPLSLLLSLVFLVEETAARAGTPVWREYRITGWVNRNLAALRASAAGLVVLLYAYQAVQWYNMDMSELNAMAAGTTQVGKEYQRREDLIHNLDNIVNNYAGHERVLFEHVSRMRAQFQGLGGAPSPAQSAGIETALMNLTALAEQYPDLKAERRFHELMEMAEISENRIAEKLNVYIEALMDFNTCNQHFWCNYWTFFGVAQLVPMPAFFEYYYSDGKYAPAVPAEDPGAPEPALRAEPPVP